MAFSHRGSPVSSTLLNHIDSSHAACFRSRVTGEIAPTTFRGVGPKGRKETLMYIGLGTLLLVILVLWLVF